jgi:hypothetical protein
MPTTLPNTTAPARRPRRPLLAELASIALVLFYLSLLAWNMATLEAKFSLLFGHDQRQGEYNPMEPGHPIAGRGAAALGAR